MWKIKNGSTDLTESQLSHLLIYGIWMQLDVLPPSHPQPGSKNKGRCVIKCYQSAIKSGENLRNYRVFRVLNRGKRVISGFVTGQTHFRSN